MPDLALQYHMLQRISSTDKVGTALPLSITVSFRPATIIFLILVTRCRSGSHKLQRCLPPPWRRVA